MTSTFEAMLARIDRTSPSFNAALPAITAMFKRHEIKLNSAQELIDVQRLHFEQHVEDYNKRINEVERIASSTSYDHSTTEYMLKALTERVEQLEKNQLRWFTETRPEREPPRDRLWHPHDVKKDSRCPVEAGDIVAVFVRGSDTPRPPEIAGRLHWGEMGALTIVGWRYAWGEE